MMKKVTLVALVLSAALGVAACGSEADPSVRASTQNLTPLFDPETGARIGGSDPATGTYYFMGGQTLAAEDRDTQFVDIESLPSEVRKLAEHPPVADAATDGTVLESRELRVWANRCCWLMTEGGAGCTGCGCVRAWEYCWDYM